MGGKPTEDSSLLDPGDLGEETATITTITIWRFSILCIF